MSGNGTLVARLLSCVSLHHIDWDTYVRLLAYVLNTQVHRQTGTSAVTLPYKWLSVTTLDEVTGPTKGMQKNMTPRDMPHWLRQMIKLMKAAVSGRLFRDQQLYKREMDKSVRQESKFNVQDYVVVDRCQFTTIVWGAARKGPSCRYNKWLQYRLDRTEYSAFNHRQ